MEITRRHWVTGSLVMTGTVAAGGAARGASRKTKRPPDAIHVAPSAGADATEILQAAIDRASQAGLPVNLAPGVYTIRRALHLRPATKLLAEHGLATFDLTAAGALTANGARDVTLAGLALTARAGKPSTADDALIDLVNCVDLELADVTITGAPAHAIRLWQCSGRIARCRLLHCGYNAIQSGNGRGLSIIDNRIDHAGNNGIVVWRDAAGPDHSIITGNYVSHIRTDAGGSGQNGNAINVFRAGHVLVAHNSMHDCAYSAVRCNAAANAQIIANTCRAIGEVALYAEFSFEGAVIANNMIDEAATGISVTNFKEGGRLATVQGNVVRNLTRRAHEPVDKRGVGISAEADTALTGNTIEGAETAAVTIGWGPFMRNVAATGNIIRQAPIGVIVSSRAPSRSVLIANNIFEQTPNGAVRLADHDRLLDGALSNDNGASGQAVAAVLSGNLMR